MTKYVKYALISLAAVAAMASCRDLSFSPYKRGDAVARVGSNELFIEDMASVFAPGMSPEDSVKLLNSYIDGWIKTQLKIEVAESLLYDNVQDIEQMVREYRTKLLIYKFENEYINNNVDTVVTKRQVSDYYMSHRSDFVMRSAMLKAVAVKFPSGFRLESQMRTLAKTAKADNIQDIIDIAIKNDLEFRQYSEWTEISEVMSYLPRLSQQQYGQVRSKTGFYEFTEGQSRYFLVITEILPEGGIMPLDMTEGTIKTMILNKRKTEMIRRLEDSLYNAAMQKGEISIRSQQQEQESE